MSGKVEPRIVLVFDHELRALAKAVCQMRAEVAREPRDAEALDKAVVNTVRLAETCVYHLTQESSIDAAFLALAVVPQATETVVVREGKR